ncbi:calcium/sodium antiporter [Geojedonia litorea]|uniref:Calcium/sodium antiporter n=1 Tax=Geojedonia litorea TaxID=1268269 RepID=A0ABV9N0K2_9FLAO
MSILLVFLGFVLLVVGGEFLVRSAVALSFKLKLSKLVIGMTVVSFATSAPELLVSLQAAISGSSDIALGNIIGSNVANIGLVLGITAIISPLVVERDFFRLNWPVMMIMSVLLYVFLHDDNHLSAEEGLIFMTLLIFFLIILIRDSRIKTKISLEGLDDSLEQTSNFKITVWLLIGAFALYFGSEWLVDGAKQLALAFEVSEYAISVTVIAIGTSVPELAASVIAALKKEKAISLGNLIGSNIFNLASVLGITAMISPITINPNSPEILSTNIFWMLGFAFIVLPLVLIPKLYQFGRWKGFLLFGAYLVFVYYAIL